eukprot:gnl/Trimastix_PCT/2316.p1 GENE.gnl/Trimastix_PCT/2316~~gnl/Trimastix_PCT/2316.p1  ORF type:complete len:633 (-),score=88.65 gnl/Trimastix_PCT/2316:110-1945(-)
MDLESPPNETSSASSGFDEIISSDDVCAKILLLSIQNTTHFEPLLFDNYYPCSLQSMNSFSPHQLYVYMRVSRRWQQVLRSAMPYIPLRNNAVHNPTKDDLIHMFERLGRPILVDPRFARLSAFKEAAQTLDSQGIRCAQPWVRNHEPFFLSACKYTLDDAVRLAEQAGPRGWVWLADYYDPQPEDGLTDLSIEVLYLAATSPFLQMVTQKTETSLLFPLLRCPSLKTLILHLDYKPMDLKATLSRSPELSSLTIRDITQLDISCLLHLPFLQSLALDGTATCLALHDLCPGGVDIAPMIDQMHCHRWHYYFADGYERSARASRHEPPLPLPAVEAAPPRAAIFVRLERLAISCEGLFHLALFAPRLTSLCCHEFPTSALPLLAKQCPHLRHLRMHSMPTPEYLIGLRSLVRRCPLETVELRLGGPEWTKTQGRALLELFTKHATSLKHLYLSLYWRGGWTTPEHGGPIDDEVLLEGLHAVPQLRALHLVIEPSNKDGHVRYMPVSARGLAHIAQACPALESLSLSLRGVTDEGVIALSALRSLTRLHLELRDTGPDQPPLTPRALEALAAGCPFLEHLYVLRGYIGSKDFLPSLAALKHLRDVDLPPMNP